MTKKELIEKNNQQFIPVDIKSIDSKNRISLGEKVIIHISRQGKVNQFQVSLDNRSYSFEAFNCYSQ
jgi:hypothetical protein